MQELPLFFKKLEEVITSNLPFVVYRKPNKNLVTVVVQNTSKLHTLNSYAAQGFVFAPFNKNEDKILFPESETTQFSVVIKNTEDLSFEDLKSNIEVVLDIKKAKEQHVLLIKNAIDFIKGDKADKIVVSRKEIIKKNNFNALNSYKKMLKNYPNAMVYLWFHPKVGCWMGASPERLIHVYNNEFKTMALAGTQAYKGTLNVDWKTKEKDEQQFVTNYILNTIENIITAVAFSKPYTVKAGNLLHIRTDVVGKLKSDKILGKLVDALHPTPAVCGLPKQTATDFIVEREGYSRSFYTGYLGELNIANECNFYVNLRCMEIKPDLISLFIGGGITKDSIAEKEWNETVFKAEVMKKIL